MTAAQLYLVILQLAQQADPVLARWMEPRKALLVPVIEAALAERRQTKPKKDRLSAVLDALAALGWTRTRTSAEREVPTGVRGGDLNPNGMEIISAEKKGPWLQASYGTGAPFARVYWNDSGLPETLAEQLNTTVEAALVEHRRGKLRVVPRAPAEVVDANPYGGTTLAPGTWLYEQLPGRGSATATVLERYVPGDRFGGYWLAKRDGGLVEDRLSDVQVAELAKGRLTPGNYSRQRAYLELQIPDPEQRAAFVEAAKRAYHHAVEDKRREEEEAAQRTASIGPWFADVLVEVGKEAGKSGSAYDVLDDVKIGKVLRKVLRSVGITAKVKVRRYSQASGMDFGVEGGWTPESRKTVNAVFPGLGGSDDAYPYAHEDRSDLQSDYHAPGGFRVARSYLETVKAAIREEAGIAPVVPPARPAPPSPPMQDPSRPEARFGPYDAGAGIVYHVVRHTMDSAGPGRRIWELRQMEPSLSPITKTYAPNGTPDERMIRNLLGDGLAGEAERRGALAPLILGERGARPSSGLGRDTKTVSRTPKNLLIDALTAKGWTYSEGSRMEYLTAPGDQVRVQLKERNARLQVRAQSGSGKGQWIDRESLGSIREIGENLAPTLRVLDKAVAQHPAPVAAPAAEPTASAEAPAGKVLIYHNATEGTVVKGETRAIKEKLSAAGLRWWGAGKLWYVPRSRGLATTPYSGGLEALAKKLGLDVAGAGETPAEAAEDAGIDPAEVEPVEERPPSVQALVPGEDYWISKGPMPVLTAKVVDRAITHHGADPFFVGAVVAASLPNVQEDAFAPERGPSSSEFRSGFRAERAEPNTTNPEAGGEAEAALRAAAREVGVLSPIGQASTALARVAANEPFRGSEEELERRVSEGGDVRRPVTEEELERRASGEASPAERFDPASETRRPVQVLGAAKVGDRLLIDLIGLSPFPATVLAFDKGGAWVQHGVASRSRLLVEEDTGGLRVLFVGKMGGREQRRTIEKITPALGKGAGPETRPPFVEEAAPATSEEPTGVSYASVDVPRTLAVAAFSGTSHVPEQRAATVLREYDEHLTDTRQRLEEAAATEGARARVEELFAAYRQGYRNRVIAWLTARQGLVSAMITGPSNFPVARQQKMGDREQKKVEELFAYQKSALGQALRELREENRGATGGVVGEIERNITQRQRDQEAWKAINTILRKKIPDGEKVNQIVALGFTAGSAQKWLTPDFAGRIGIPDYALQNNLKEIKRLQGRLVEEQGKTQRVDRETLFEGGSVVYNVGEDRLQILFDKKPDEALREKLKTRGFKWSPNSGAWQRQLTDNAVVSAELALGIDQLPRVGQRENPARSGDLVALFRAHAPRTGARVELAEGAPSDFPAARDRAYTEGPFHPGPVFRVVVNPILLDEHPNRRAGVLLHELGHASLMAQGDLDHPERAADDEAHRLFGHVIRYDTEDIQTIGPGVSPRPSHLSA